MKFIGYNIVPILLVILAGYMIYANKSDWGWVIFAAFLLTNFPSNSDDGDGNEDSE